MLALNNMDGVEKKKGTMEEIKGKVLRNSKTLCWSGAVISEFMQQDSRGNEKGGKKTLCDRLARAIIFMFCHDLYLILLCSGLLQKDLVQ